MKLSICEFLNEFEDYTFEINSHNSHGIMCFYNTNPNLEVFEF